MTDEFMSTYQFMNKQKQREAELRVKAKKLEEEHQLELKAYERGQINYENMEAVAEKPQYAKKKEVFEARKQAGRIKTANALANNKDVVEQTCDNGHDLFVTRRTNKMDPKCFHCESDIKYKEQMITCTGNCKVSMCLKCSGCSNAHVVHRKIVREPLSAKSNSCLRCMKGLAHEQAVNWCFDCEQAFCPEECNREAQQVD